MRIWTDEHYRIVAGTPDDEMNFFRVSWPEIQRMVTRAQWMLFSDYDISK